MSKRLKVLVSAYACSPFKGSEPGVGWGFVHALAELHELHVIVEEEKFRGDIERWLTEHPDFATKATFHFLRKRRNRWLRKLWPPSYYWYYREWHQRALALAQRLHATEHFDLVHQLTMVGFREPGYLWRMDLPFVWGPVGGMGVFPWRFLPAVGLRGAIYFLGYNLYNILQMRWLRRPRLAAGAAGPGLIAATRENQVGARQHWGTDASLLCEVGLPSPVAHDFARRSVGEPLRLIWSGQHTPGKALNLALHALLPLDPRIRWTLDVLGVGARTSHWKRLARALGLGDRVRFHGWLERKKAIDLMASAHVLLITSLRDLTSTVTVEALAVGLPVVCPNHCGFADVVDDSCGIRVPVDRPERMIIAITEAIHRVESDENFRSALAMGALQRALSFDWTHKAQALDEVYAQTLAAHRTRGGR